MLEFLTHSIWADRIGWVLVHSFWQFMLVALTAIVVRRALQRCSANLRYGALLAAMIIMVAIPVATWFSPWLVDAPAAAVKPEPIERIENTPPSQLADDPMPMADMAPASPKEKLQTERAVLQPEPIGLASAWSVVKSHVQPWLAEIVLVWLAGVVVVAMRLLLSWHTVRRLRRIGVSPAGESVQGLLDRTAEKLGLVRAVEVLQSTLVWTPVVLGFFRPLVLLPACVVTGLSPGQLESILAHELAHVRRHDYLVNLLQTLVETIFFYHPAVWWLSRQIRNERENCCDDVALGIASSRADYGRALLAIEELRAASPAVVLAASNGSLLARIRRIAGRESTPRVAGGGSIFGVILVSIAILAAGTWGAARSAEKPQANDSSAKQVTANAESLSDAPMEPCASVGDVVEGVVVDEQDKPVAGVTVRACERQGEDSTTTSNVDGTFRLPVREPFVHNMALTASDADKTRQALLTLGLQNKPCRLVLKLSHAVNVTVVDAGAQPVAGAPVAALVWNGQVALGATDAQGKVRLDIPADARNVCIMAYKPSVGMDYFETDADFTAMPDDPRYSPPDAARLVLDGAAPIEVRTVDAVGRPVSGLIVKLSDMWKTSKKRFMAWNAKLVVRSDAEGRAIFNWLPAKLDRISFSVSAEDGNYVEREAVEFRITEGGDPSHLTARVVRAATFSGQVTFPDGKPVAGILLRAEGRPGSQPKIIYDRSDARTANDGSYRFKVMPNQDYIVAVCDDRWAAKSHLGLIAHEGERREHLDFQLDRGTLIRGTVTAGPNNLPGNDANRTYQIVNLVQLGPPIPDAWKWPTRTQRGPEQYQTSVVRWIPLDAKGRYSTRVAPGEYDLQLPSGKREHVVVADQAELVIDDHLEEQSPKPLHGRAVDKAGKPVPNAVVAFPTNLRLTTDTDGRFSTFGNLGPCRIHARSAEANLAGSQTIAKGDSQVTIELLPAATATGRVLDAAGRPLAGVRVHYDFFLHPPAEHCWFPVDTETDKDGKYAMAGLPIGFQGDDVTVVWYDPAKQAYEVFDGPKLTVKPGENRLSDTILKPTALKADGQSSKTSAANQANENQPAKPADSASPGKEKLSREPSAPGRPRPPGYLPLITMKYERLKRLDIRRHYGIDADQEKRLRQFCAELEPVQAEIAKANKERQKLPPKQQKVTQEYRDKVERAAKTTRKVIEKVLTAKQQAEYHLDDLCHLAISVCTNLNDEDKHLGLDLSPQQRRRLYELAFDHADATEQCEGDENQRMLAALTAEQRERLMARFPDVQMTEAHVFFPPPEIARLHLAPKIVLEPLSFEFRSRNGVILSVPAGVWNEAVRKQMELSSEQVWKLEAIEAKSAAAAQQIFGFYESKEVPHGLSDDEEKAKRAEYRQKLETLGTDIRRQIDETLTVAQRQIVIDGSKRGRACNALRTAVRDLNDAIFDDLHVTAEQRAKIRDICSEAAVRQLVPDRATGERALAALTPQQRQKLEERLDRIGW